MKIISFLLISLNILAGSWNGFKTKKLSEIFPVKNTKIIVVHSGESLGKELEDAFNTLVDNLKNIKNIEKVLSNKFMGDVSKLDDKSIVKRGSFLDVDNIIIIRVFKDGEKISSVASVYDKKGNLITGIFADKNSQKTEKQPETTSDVSQKEVNKPSDSENKDIKGEKEKKSNKDIVNEVLKEKTMPDKKLKKALNEFSENYITFENITLITLSRDSVNVDNITKPIVGKYEKEISWYNFYKKVGRNDLADKYDNMQTISYVFYGIAGIIFMGDIVYYKMQETPYSDEQIKNASGSERWQKMIDANNDHDEAVMINSGIILGASVVSLITGFIVGRYHPASEAKRRKLADKYNRKLMKKLGIRKKDLDKLDELDDIDETSETTDLKYSVVPVFGKNFNGISLKVDF